MAGVTGLGERLCERTILRLYACYEKHLGFPVLMDLFCLPRKRSVPTLPLPSSRVLRSICPSRSLRCSTSGWMT
jgi:hypothetical protein